MGAGEHFLVSFGLICYSVTLFWNTSDAHTHGNNCPINKHRTPYALRYIYKSANTTC